MNRIMLSMLLVLVLCMPPVIANELISPTPPGAEVYFIAPSDGQTVTSPVIVRFGLRGMGVAPAGVDKEKTGHHHLLINTDIASVNMQLLLGNYLHIPHAEPVLSNPITIMVE